MPKRVRLTERRKQAVDGSIPYPGNVNQPDRQFKQHDQYDNWEETINHPLPDMRHDWKNDERDEIGFGIPEPWGTNPTVASVKVAANKAVKLAYLLLGEKVDEEVIEKQANDFMLLGPDALDRSLARFAQTGELYAEEEEADVKEAAEEEESDVKEAATEVEAEDKGKEEEEKAAETIQEEKEEEAKKEASEELAEEAAEEAAPAEDTGASEVEASETKEAATEVVAEDDEDDDDDDDDDEDDSDEEDSKEASVQTAGDMDIELSSAMDDGAVEEDSRLAGLFDDDIPAELPEPGAGSREASAKKGIKSLGGGQPKVASGDAGSTDISSIWSSAPDVSEIFN